MEDKYETRQESVGECRIGACLSIGYDLHSSRSSETGSSRGFTDEGYIKWYSRSSITACKRVGWYTDSIHWKDRCGSGYSTADEWRGGCMAEPPDGKCGRILKCSYGAKRGSSFGRKTPQGRCGWGCGTNGWVDTYYIRKCRRICKRWILCFRTGGICLCKS